MKLETSSRKAQGIIAAACAAAIVGIALTACGGNNDVVSVSGVAATGAPMASANISVKCVNGNVASTTSDSVGNYSTVAGGILPCMIEADDGVRKLHSVASGSGKSATANVTPLTEQLLASLSQDTANTADFFSRFDGSQAPLVSKDKLDLAQAAVLSNLRAAGLDTSKVDDLISSRLVAQTGNQSGNDYDKLLDSVAATPVNVRLIAINDFHGNFAPPSSLTMTLPNGGAGQKATVGGAAYMATLVKNLKAANPNNIMVGAGDSISASPFESAITHDEATVDILNNIGLEVTSVGNHEFDRGRDELLRIQNGGCYPKSGTEGVVGVDTCLVNGLYPGAKFKYLAANVNVTATGKTFLPATYVKRFGAVSVGFIGLTFQGTPTAVSLAGVAGLEFKEESAVINQYAAALKASGVTAVVVLIHQGGQTTATTVNDKTCPGFSGDITPIVDKLSNKVDVVVSGHTHQEYVCSYPAKAAGKNILLTSTGLYGGAVTSIDMVLQPNKGMLSAVGNTVPVIRADVAANATLPSGFTSVAKDADIDALVTKYKNLSNTLAASSVGAITSDIKRALTTGSTPTRDETAEGALGAVMADSYLIGVPGGADIAFVNPGSVRADLIYTAPGTVTYSMLSTVEPFGNTLVTLNLTGAQIQSLLEQQWSAANRTAKTNPATGGAGRLLQVSKGLTYSFDNTKIAGNFAVDGSPIVAGTLKLNGVAIDPAKSYKIVTNSFLSLGGDNFGVMATGTNVTDSKMLDLDAFIAYFKANSPVSPPAARITRLN